MEPISCIRVTATLFYLLALLSSQLPNHWAISGWYQVCAHWKQRCRPVCRCPLNPLFTSTGHQVQHFKILKKYSAHWTLLLPLSTYHHVSHAPPKRSIDRWPSDHITGQTRAGQSLLWPSLLLMFERVHLTIFNSFQPDGTPVLLRQLFYLQQIFLIAIEIIQNWSLTDGLFHYGSVQYGNAPIAWLTGLQAIPIPFISSKQGNFYPGTK